MKKLILSLCMVLTMVGVNVTTVNAADVWDGASKLGPLEGSGTPGDPYLIQSCANFRYFIDNPGSLSDNYLLTVDLDFDNHTMPSVGDFSGFFDGNNKKLYNINVNGNGLFNKTIGITVYIANLGIESGNINGSAWGKGLVAVAQGSSLTISGCYSKARLEGNNGEAAGIIGKGDANAKVLNCYAMPIIASGSGGGGLVGLGNGIPVSNSYAVVDLTNYGHNANYYVGNGVTNQGAYYDSDIAGLTNTYGRTTLYMQSLDFVDELIGAQTQPVWLADTDNVNGGYPILNEAYRIAIDIPGANMVAEEGYDPIFQYKGEDYKFTLGQNDPLATPRNIEIKVNGVEIFPGGDGVYTIPEASSRPVIICSGYFARDNYNTVLNYGIGGEITGNVSPAFNATEIYTITPDAGYRVHTVFVNDEVYKSIDKTETQVSLTITDDNVISATFVLEADVDVWENTSDISGGLSGSGTAVDPYLIQSCADWKYLSSQSDLYTGMYEFLLTKHLDFNNLETPVIGSNATPFVGFFNGNNKTVINVKFTTNIDGTGLFGAISGNGANKYNSMICNLGVVSGTNTSNSGHLGGIVGRINSSQSTDFFDGKTYAFSGSIFNCYNYADLRNAGNNMGGIVGRNYTANNYIYIDVMLANCYNRGNTRIGIGGEVNSRYPYHSVYNSGTLYASGEQSTRIYSGNGFGVLNAFYDPKYNPEGGYGTTASAAKTTEEMCSQEMVDLLNAGPGAPYYKQKAWTIDTNGAINAGKPYLNEAYRVYSTTAGLTFAPAGGYSPHLVYKGDTYVFRLTSVTDGDVLVNGTPVTPDVDGYYTVTGISGNLVITTNGAVSAPTDIDVWDGKTVTAITNGDGSANDPWQINSAAEFVWAAQNMTTTSSMILMKDLDFDTFWVPELKGDFAGTFDGNNHILYNYHTAYEWTASSGANTGLFSSIAGGGVLKNLRMEAGYIYGTNRIGGFAGSNSGTIDHCGFNGILIARDGTAGGFIGHGGGTISNSYSIGQVVAKNAAGVLGDGNNYSGTIKNSYVANNRSNFAHERSGLVLTNTFVMGEGESYNKTKAELKSQDILSLLNADQGKVWKLDPARNDGFPMFNEVYTVTFPASITNGTFEPADGYSATTAYNGDDYKFSIVPVDESYTAEAVKVFVNGGSEPLTAVDGVFTVSNVTGDIVVTYTDEIKIKTFAFTMIYESTQGTIATTSTSPVNYGSNVTFTVTAKDTDGYEIDEVTLDGTPIQLTNGEYTVEDVTAAFEIAATFKLMTYQIAVTTPTNGSIDLDLDSNSANPVTWGTNTTFNFTPDTGYEVKEVWVDGTDIGPQDSYTFSNVKAIHSLEVTFSKIQYTVTVDNTDTNGTIVSQTGVNTVLHGENVTFSITPDAANGYEIASITVNGAPLTTFTKDGFDYTFTNVQDNSQTITATYALKQYTITVSASGDGTISPDIDQTVTHGDMPSFVITPDMDYEIESVTVNGTALGESEFDKTGFTYTFDAVTEDGSIAVVFTKTPTGLRNGSLYDVVMNYKQGNLYINANGLQLNKVRVYTLSGGVIAYEENIVEQTTLFVGDNTAVIVVLDANGKEITRKVMQQ